MLADLMQFPVQIAAAGGCLAASGAALLWYRRIRTHHTRLLTALNNMSEGLCMFDSSARLILCNERWAALGAGVMPIKRWVAGEQK